MKDCRETHIHGFSLFRSFIREEDKVNNISTLPFIDTNLRVLQIPHCAQSFPVSVQVTASLTAHTDDVTQ
jgi:hypothetical protein